MLVRAPERGRVKSRLASGLDEDTVLRLYKAFVADLLNSFSDKVFHLILFYSPPEAARVVGEWLGDTFEVRPQVGSDLGERMKHAFAGVLDEFTRAVLIGSDSPDLTPDVVDEAFNALEVSQAVLGPSCDGGYYLIGFRSDTFPPEVFEGMPWGSDTVFSRTLERLREKGLSTHLLPLWLDVDRVEDLDTLAAKHEDSAFSESETMKCLRSLDRWSSGGLDDKI